RARKTETGAASAEVPEGAIAIAAITSCTNTSNAHGMIRAGLLAKAAVARGLAPAPWVKTSLAPGSRAVTTYLERAGLLAPLEPPFFTHRPGGFATQERVAGARVLGVFADGLTTDHISPGGEIPADSPSGQYLQSLGIAPCAFNSYIGRRGNHEVMMRGTFAH